MHHLSPQRETLKMLTANGLIPKHGMVRSPLPKHVPYIVPAGLLSCRLLYALSLYCSSSMCIMSCLSTCSIRMLFPFFLLDTS